MHVDRVETYGIKILVMEDSACGVHVEVEETIRINGS